VRPKPLVASVVLTAALALVALPGIAGSQSPSSATVLDPAAFQPIDITASTAGREVAIRPLSAVHDSAGRLERSAAFGLPGAEPVREVGRPTVRLPAARMGAALKPPKQTLSGVATFYHHGTTAMRLPRGTVIVICGAGGCIERTVTDYGPSKAGGRVIDLYRPDFFAICGCGWWSGTTQVTVRVY
jgi:hypothetical protein